jgi:membrane-bound lytic murein transglycosylase MltF
VKRGYARGWEPVRFVENIRGYIDILDWVATDTRPTPVAVPADVTAAGRPQDSPSTRPRPALASSQPK